MTWSPMSVRDHILTRFPNGCPWCESEDWLDGITCKECSQVPFDNETATVRGELNLARKRLGELA